MMLASSKILMNGLTFQRLVSSRGHPLLLHDLLDHFRWRGIVSDAILLPIELFLQPLLVASLL